MNRRLYIVAGGIALASALSLTPALAAPGDHGNGQGGCVDNFYGNATNPRHNAAISGDVPPEAAAFAPASAQNAAPICCALKFCPRSADCRATECWDRVEGASCRRESITIAPPLAS